MTFLHKGLIALKNGFLRNPFNFHGRASRREFFGVVTVILLISQVLDYFYEPMALFLAEIFTDVVFVAFGIFLLVLRMNVSVRRLHDIGRSGWWVVLFFVSYLFFLMLLDLLINFFLALFPRATLNEFFRFIFNGYILKFPLAETAEVLNFPPILLACILILIPLSLLTFLGFFFYCLIKKGTSGENKYGKPLV